MRFNPDDYEDVDSRVHRFREDYPEGRITTRLEHYFTDDHGALVSCVISAAIYRTENGEVASTGLAQEHRAERGTPPAFLLEAGETSAVGRALATLGYSPKGKRPSREEMQKVAEVAAHKTTRRGSSDPSAGAPSAGGEGISPWSGSPTLPDPSADTQLEQAVAEVARNLGGVEVPVPGAENAVAPDEFARAENAKRIARENGLDPKFAGGRKFPSERQMKMLGARFKDLGVTDKAARLAYVRHALERPEVNSPDDLLSGEMSVVIDLLGLDIDRQAEAGKESNREDPWAEEGMI